MTRIIPPNIFAAAVRWFWRARKRQGRAQHERGTRDQGNRSETTGGQQMDGFVRTIMRLLVANGVPRGDISTGKVACALPGFFRSSKQWDIVVSRESELIVALELKSHIGSFGNNFNNRTEEALGTAVDIWTAYREGAFQMHPRPWIGYLLLLEDSDGSRKPLQVYEPHFKVFDEFRDTSYAERYELFCRRLVRERQYSASCLILADAAHVRRGECYIEPSHDLSATTFLQQLIAHVRQVYRR